MSSAGSTFSRPQDLIACVQSDLDKRKLQLPNFHLFRDEKARYVKQKIHVVEKNMEGLRSSLQGYLRNHERELRKLIPL